MTDTIPNVPRELLERAVRIPTKASVEENHAAIVDRGRAQSELRALLSAPSPAGVDGLEVVGYVSQDDIKWQGDCTLRIKPYSDYTIPLCRLSDAAAIIDGLRGENERIRLNIAEYNEAISCYQSERDQQAQRIGELEGLLRSCLPALSDGGCAALANRIDAALSAGKEGA